MSIKDDGLVEKPWVCCCSLIFFLEEQFWNSFFDIILHDKRNISLIDDTMYLKRDIFDLKLYLPRLSLQTWFIAEFFIIDARKVGKSVSRYLRCIIGNVLTTWVTIVALVDVVIYISCRYHRSSFIICRSSHLTHGTHLKYCFFFAECTPIGLLLWCLFEYSNDEKKHSRYFLLLLFCFLRIFVILTFLKRTDEIHWIGSPTTIHQDPIIYDEWIDDWSTDTQWRLT